MWWLHAVPNQPSSSTRCPIHTRDQCLTNPPCEVCTPVHSQSLLRICRRTLHGLLPGLPLRPRSMYPSHSTLQVPYGRQIRTAIMLTLLFLPCHRQVLQQEEKSNRCWIRVPSLEISFLLTLNDQHLAPFIITNTPKVVCSGLDNTCYNVSSTIALLVSYFTSVSSALVDLTPIPAYFSMAYISSSRHLSIMTTMMS